MVDEKIIFKTLVNNEKDNFESLKDLTKIGKIFFVCSVHLFLQEADISINKKCLKTFEYIEKNGNFTISRQKMLTNSIRICK